MTGRLVAQLRRLRRTLSRAALLRTTQLFDAAWYARTYPDVAVSTFDPAFHFAAFGATENRDCGPGFDSHWYQTQYPDVAATGIHPLLHYLEFGAAEGREWRAVPLPATDFSAAAEPPAGEPVSCEPTAEASSQDPFPNCYATRRATVNEEVLGRHLPEVTILPVVLGFAVRTTPIKSLRRAVDSAALALEGIQQCKPGSLLVADDYAIADVTPLISWRVSCLPPRGKVGFASAHNRMMEVAFGAGAEIYVAAHPAGAFAPDALIMLLRMIRANGRRALVEATRAPQPVPKPVGAGAASWAVPWSSGACLAIPRTIYETNGGFDEALASWGDDVDFTWRARAAGFSVLICPDALIELPFQSEAECAIPAGYLASAIVLARKWRLLDLEASLTNQLEKTGGKDMPEAATTMLPEVALLAAEFGSGPFVRDMPW